MGYQDTLDVTLQGDASGRGIRTRSQLEDYVLRPAEFEDFNIIDFFVNTYEEPLSKAPGDTLKRFGPIPNVRGRYKDGHQMASKLQRKARQVGHNHLPNFIGKPFPRAEEASQSRILYGAISCDGYDGEGARRRT
jgi:hypothetical protein